MEPDLRGLVRRAAGDSAPAPDLDAVREAVARRRRRRRGISVLAAAVAVALALPIWDALEPDPKVSVAGEVEGPVEPALHRFDPAADARPDAPRLDPAAVSQQPRVLPRGYLRCAGPSHPTPSTTTTTFCGPTGDVELRTGAHPDLEERGDPVHVGTRVGWLRPANGGGWVLTLSDRDSMDDTHYRVEVPADFTPAAALELLRSIPAVATATG